MGSRRNFLGTLAAVAAAPFVKGEKQILAPPGKELHGAVLPPNATIAIDISALPQDMTADEVLKLYKKTGMLIYCKDPAMPNYKPYTIINGTV